MWQGVLMSPPTYPYCLLTLSPLPGMSPCFLFQSNGWNSTYLSSPSLNATCYGLNGGDSPKLACWNPNSEGDGIRRWTCGRSLGHEVRTSWMALRKGWVCLLALFLMHEDAVRRHMSVNQEEARHQEPDLTGPLISDLQPPELWDINIHCLSPLCMVCVIAAWAKSPLPCSLPWLPQVGFTI